MPVYTLFSQGITSTLTADNLAYTMGVQFTSTLAGTLTAVWFYSPPAATDLPAEIALYAVTGASLITHQAASWSGAAGSGWVRAPFTSPPAISPAVKYKAAIFHNGTGNFYGGIAHYWDTGAGASGISNGPLSAPNNAGGDGGQDTFTQSGALAYPASSFNAANYMVDPELTVPAAQLPPQGGGRSMLKRSMMWADL